MQNLRKMISMIVIVLLISALVTPAFAENRRVSNVIVVMPVATPVQTLAPEASAEAESTLEPTETVAPEGTMIPEGTDVPEATHALEETVEPWVTLDPAETVALEATHAPEETVEPWATLGPAKTVTSAVTLAPVETFEPLVTLDPEATLAPEENILPEATPETRMEAEFPGTASVLIQAALQGNAATPSYGDRIRLIAILEGLDGFQYHLQWQQCKDDGQWFDIADANAPTLNFIMTEENANDSWRLSVVCYAKQNPETPNDEQVATVEQQDEAEAMIARARTEG